MPLEHHEHSDTRRIRQDGEVIENLSTHENNPSNRMEGYTNPARTSTAVPPRGHEAVRQPDRSSIGTRRKQIRSGLMSRVRAWSGAGLISSAHAASSPGTHRFQRCGPAQDGRLVCRQPRHADRPRVGRGPVYPLPGGRRRCHAHRAVQQPARRGAPVRGHGSAAAPCRVLGRGSRRRARSARRGGRHVRRRAPDPGRVAPADATRNPWGFAIQLCKRGATLSPLP